MSSSQSEGYAQVNDRLKEILRLVDDDSISLDAALDLFDEAVKLGIQASTMLEEDIVTQDE